MRTVTTTQAKRQFSKLLSAVRAGETVRITLRGEPAATLAPPERALVEIDQAKTRLLARLDRVEPNLIPSWRRDDLYD